MKNIKDITISIFAIIGFVSIVTGFTNEAENAVQQSSSILASPESHVWHIAEFDNKGLSYMYNKKTGELRVLSSIAVKKYYLPKPVEK